MSAQSPEASKERILKEALALFAEQGFSGTSVREIAKAANVNVAAVNYYFENKANLQMEVIRQAHVVMGERMTGMAAKDSQELILGLFDRFMGEAPMLVAIFRMFISGTSRDLMERLCDEGHMGPPGSELLMEMLTKETGAQGSDLLWAARTLMNEVIYNVVMLESAHFEDPNKRPPFKADEKEVREGLVRLVRAVVRDLKG